MALNKELNALVSKIERPKERLYAWYTDSRNK
jgi:hypothetical protein